MAGMTTKVLLMSKKWLEPRAGHMLSYAGYSVSLPVVTDESYNEQT